MKVINKLGVIYEGTAVGCSVIELEAFPCPPVVNAVAAVTRATRMGTRRE